MDWVKKLWTARKLYGSGNTEGNGGILPPTDPRLDDLTEEQFELDIELYLDDHPELRKKAESYKDTEYEQAMKEDLAVDPSTFVDEPYEP